MAQRLTLLHTKFKSYGWRKAKIALQMVSNLPPHIWIFLNIRWMHRVIRMSSHLRHANCACNTWWWTWECLLLLFEVATYKERLKVLLDLYSKWFTTSWLVSRYLNGNTPSVVRMLILLQDFEMHESQLLWHGVICLKYEYSHVQKKSSYFLSTISYCTFCTGCIEKNSIVPDYKCLLRV